MYKLKEYRNKYSKISKRLWQYHRDEPALTSDGAIKKKTGYWIIAPLNYLSNFWRTLEMPLAIFEINLILILSNKCVFSNNNR